MDHLTLHMLERSLEVKWQRFCQILLIETGQPSPDLDYGHHFDWKVLRVIMATP
jgi:hypothetical protein